MPKTCLWKSLKCNRKLGSNSPVPFIILSIVLKEEMEEKRYAFLPVGTSKHDYGDLLDGYEVKRLGDTLKVGKVTWRTPRTRAYNFRNSFYE